MRKETFRQARAAALCSAVIIERMDKLRGVLLGALEHAGFSAKAPKFSQRTQASGRSDNLFLEASVWDSLGESTLTVRVGLNLSGESDKFGGAGCFWGVVSSKTGAVTGPAGLARSELFTAMPIEPFRLVTDLADPLVLHLRDHFDSCETAGLETVAHSTVNQLVEGLAP